LKLRLNDRQGTCARSRRGKVLRKIKHYFYG
jgi:hypothetical protein